MLKITIPAIELYNEVTKEFIASKETILILEHSLVSLSKWESKWCKPFLSKTEKTLDEIYDYIRCMTTTQNVDASVYSSIDQETVKQVNDYIEASMTATTFIDDKKTINREVVTAELIYYWMITLNIPLDCQKWHLNRLFTLINVFNVKNGPKKKMGKKELMNRNVSLNEARKQSLNTKG